MQTTVVNADGERLLKAPDFTGSLSLDYRKQLPGGLLESNLSGYYSSAYAWDLSRRVQTDGYALFNATIGYKPRNSRFSYSVWAKNLTNKAYISGTVLTAEADAVLYAPPREVGVSVKVGL
jgi:iron complex outermembrane receptor protein